MIKINFLLNSKRLIVTNIFFFLKSELALSETYFRVSLQYLVPDLYELKVKVLCPTLGIL